MSGQVRRLRLLREGSGSLAVHVYRSSGSASCYALVDLGDGDIAILDGRDMEELEARLGAELGVIAHSRELLRGPI